MVPHLMLSALYTLPKFCKIPSSSTAMHTLSCAVPVSTASFLWRVSASVGTSNSLHFVLSFLLVPSDTQLHISQPTTRAGSLQLSVLTVPLLSALGLAWYALASCFSTIRSCSSIRHCSISLIHASPKPWFLAGNFLLCSQLHSKDSCSAASKWKRKMKHIR